MDTQWLDACVACVSTRHDKEEALRVGGRGPTNPERAKQQRAWTAFVEIDDPLPIDPLA